MSLIKSNTAGLGGAGSPGGALGSFYDHTIDKSLRFEEGGSGYLSFTPSATGTDNKKYTLSLWIKLAQGSSDFRTIFSSKNTGAGTGQGHNTYAFGTDDDFEAYTENGAANPYTTTKFRDVTSWFNVVIAYDSTQATDTNRVKIFINGERDVTLAGTFPGADSVMSSVNTSGQEQRIGRYVSGFTRYFNGYMAEIHMVDGQALSPSNFGETKDGVWIPKEYANNGTTSHGANGYHLDFADSSSIGNDVSGNNNDFTASGFGTYDVMPDSPTNNWATLNSLKVNSATQTFAEGNLDFSSTQTSTNPAVTSTFVVGSDKWYWEVYIRASAGSNSIGIAKHPNALENDSYALYVDDDAYQYMVDGTTRNGSSTGSYGDSWTTGDIIGVALDLDAGAVYFYKNGTIQNSGTAAFTSLSGEFSSYGLAYQNGAHVYNFGQDDTFNNNKTSGSANASDSSGLGQFYYSVPSGYKSLCASNLPSVTLGPGKTEQPNDFFDTILYTGNGNELAVGTGGMRRPLDTISIAQSVIFDSASSPELYKSWTSNATDRKHFTVAFWVKRASLGTQQTMLQCDTSGGQATQIIFDTDDKLRFNVAASGTGQRRLITRREFKDVRTFYHITCAYDSEASTASERARIYVNGIEETSFDTDERSSIAGTDVHGIMENGQSVNTIGFRDHSGTSKNFLNGYLCDYHCIDGQTLQPTSFGQIGANDDWIPIAYSGSYGNNGFRLTFADSSAFGDDTSGNTNDFTSANLDTSDKVFDSPTQNFATFDPTRTSGTTLTYSEGNLKAERTSTHFAQAYSNVVITEGKFYAEFYLDVGNSGVGIIAGNTLPAANKFLGQDSYTYAYYFDGRKVNNGSYTSYGDSYTVAADGSSDIVGVMIDADAGDISFTKNGTVQNSGVPAFSGVTGPFRFAIASEGGIASGNCFHIANFGQDDTFNGLKTSGSAAAADENGNGKFYDTPPTGFLALMDDNLPRKSDVIGPDWVWIKGRSNTTVHSLHDTLRGTQLLQSNAPDGQQDNANYLLSFDSQGFTVGDSSNVNQSTHSYVGWVWRAGGKPTADNAAAAGAEPTAGSAKIDGSNKSGAFSGSPSIAIKRLSASTTAGFSIVRWTGTGSAGTIPHGLGVTPEFIYVKNLEDDTKNWNLYPTILGNNYLELNGTGSTFSGSTYFNNTAPTANVFSVGSAGSTNNSSDDFIAYVFAPIEGYSRFSSYTGGGSNFPFVFTGFRPAWLMIKRSGSGGWHMFDSKRSFSGNYFSAGAMNEIDVRIEAQDTGSENTSGPPHIDFLSNGFKLRTSFDNMNASGGTYIYLAFAEAPFKFSNAR